MKTAKTLRKKKKSDLVPARIEYLRVKNYRALKAVEFKDLKPLTVLLGPNGSGKSTVFDVFDFLAECFQLGLRHAWERRGRAKELKTRGQTGPIEIEIKYREVPDFPPTRYYLAIDEKAGKVFVAEELLELGALPAKGRIRFAPHTILHFRKGRGHAISGKITEFNIKKNSEISLSSPDLLAVNSLGQLAEHGRAAALREFISNWYVSYLSIDDIRGQPEAGPRERLSKTGDNLPNVIQYLKEQHPERLDRIFQALRRRIPRLNEVLAEAMPDGRLLLQIKDAPFERPVLARFASDGTLKMLAYLIALYDPEAPPFIGIEEPENFLHPRLLPELAEECRAATERTQLLVTTHSPFFLDAIKPEEIRALYRDENGYTQAVWGSDIPGILDFLEEGATMGQLWMENRFGVGDPLVNSGAPQNRGRAR